MVLSRRSLLRGAAAGTLVALLPPGSIAYAHTPDTPAPGGTSRLTFRAKGAAVRSLQRKLGVRVDGVFGKQTLGAVINKQLAAGLVPDGVVGPLTWRHINNASLPPAGASFKATGARRIVYDKLNRIAFLVREDGTVERWGWGIHNPKTTLAKTTPITALLVENRNADEKGDPGPLVLPHFVRFQGKPPRSNGFHAIPRNTHKGNRPIHSESLLGRGTGEISKGCIRLSEEFALFLFNWVRNGTLVTVVNRMLAGV